MNAYELCQRHVVTVRRHEELTTSARMMRERNVGCLVVVEPAGALGGERPTLEDALQRMRSAGVRRVPVVDDRGRLAGFLAIDDIFEHMSQRVPLAATPIRRESRFEQISHP